MPGYNQSKIVQYRPHRPGSPVGTQGSVISGPVERGPRGSEFPPRVWPVRASGTIVMRIARDRSVNRAADEAAELAVPKELTIAN